MKKSRAILILLPLLTLFLAVSCPNSFQLPTKVRIKAAPALTVSTPLTITKENIGEYMDNYIQEAAAEMEGLEFYDYYPASRPWGDTKTYLIRYRGEEYKNEFSFGDEDPLEFDIGPFPFTGDVPDHFEETINLPSPLTLPAGTTVNIGEPLGETLYVPLDLDPVKGAKIKTGVLTVGVSGDNIDYSDLDAKIGAQTLPIISGTDGRERNLANIVLTGSPSLALSGTIEALSDTSISDLSIALDIAEFEYVTIETDDDLSISETIPVDLGAIAADGIIKKISYNTLDVALKFETDASGFDPIRIDGLTVEINASDLGLSTSATTDGSFDENGYHKLSFVPSSVPWELDFSSLSSPTDVTVTVNPGPPYGDITLHNVKPGQLSVSGTVRVDVATVTLDLTKFVQAEDTTGTFPDPVDGPLNLRSWLEGMDSLTNINLDTAHMGLYVALDGDTDFFAGSTINLTVKDGVPSSGIEKNLTIDELDTVPKPPIDFFPSPAGYTPGMTFNKPLADIEGKYRKFTQLNDMIDVINTWPENLTVEYELDLSDNLVINWADIIDANNTMRISFTPEVLVVMPLQLQIKKDDSSHSYGTLNILAPDSGSDLFGRTGPDDTEIDEYINMLRSASIRVDYDNTLLGGLELVLFSETPSWSKTIALQTGTGRSLLLDVGPEQLKYPFMPGFKIQVPCESGKDYGLISIKRGAWDQTGFSVKITATIEADVNMEFDL
jgi:hypothetical protein